MKSPKYNLGDVVHFPIESKSFGRIATQNAKNVILQKIREEERSMQFNEWVPQGKGCGYRYCAALSGPQCEH